MTGAPDDALARVPGHRRRRDARAVGRCARSAPRRRAGRSPPSATAMGRGRSSSSVRPTATKKAASGSCCGRDRSRCRGHHAVGGPDDEPRRPRRRHPLPGRWRRPQPSGAEPARAAGRPNFALAVRPSLTVWYHQNYGWVGGSGVSMAPAKRYQALTRLGTLKHSGDCAVGSCGARSTTPSAAARSWSSCPTRSPRRCPGPCAGAARGGVERRDADGDSAAARECGGGPLALVASPQSIGFVPPVTWHPTSGGSRSRHRPRVCDSGPRRPSIGHRAARASGTG